MINKNFTYLSRGVVPSEAQKKMFTLWNDVLASEVKKDHREMYIDELAEGLERLRCHL